MPRQLQRRQSHRRQFHLAVRNALGNLLEKRQRGLQPCAHHLLGREGEQGVVGDVELLELRQLAQLRRQPLQPVVHRRQNLELCEGREGGGEEREAVVVQPQLLQRIQKGDGRRQHQERVARKVDRRQKWHLQHRRGYEPERHDRAVQAASRARLLEPLAVLHRLRKPLRHDLQRDQLRNRVDRALRKRGDFLGVEREVRERRPVVDEGARERVEGVQLHREREQVREAFEGRGEAAELVVLQVQLLQPSEAADLIRERRDEVVAHVEHYQRHHFLDRSWDLSDLVVGQRQAVELVCTRVHLDRERVEAPARQIHRTVDQPRLDLAEVGHEPRHALAKQLGRDPSQPLVMCQVQQH
mmetsp:Transcript_17438/g.39126  ORF Transcript_17438/g.39126 Transcript_17438/m.39126 type:complete len:356 (+) Transcript_17438:554-1621(+)